MRSLIAASQSCSLPSFKWTSVTMVTILLVLLCSAESGAGPGRRNPFDQGAKVSKGYAMGESAAARADSFGCSSFGRQNCGGGVSFTELILQGRMRSMDRLRM